MTKEQKRIRKIWKKLIVRNRKSDLRRWLEFKFPKIFGRRVTIVLADGTSRTIFNPEPASIGPMTMSGSGPVEIPITVNYTHMKDENGVTLYPRKMVFPFPKIGRAHV